MPVPMPPAPSPCPAHARLRAFVHPAPLALPLTRLQRLRHPNSRVCASASPGGVEPLPFERLFLKGPVPGDKLVRTISASGEVSCRTLISTGLVTGAARLHQTSALATSAFGRLLTCSLLVAAGKKDGEQFQIQFRTNGPINGITAIADGLGHVRGYMGNPSVTLPARQSDNQLDVPAAIGEGVLAVVRTSPMSKSPYTGLCAVSSGEVAEDIAQYFLKSEQTPSALAAGVSLHPDGTVAAAAGFLVQLLPGASDETVNIVERNVSNMGSPTEFVRNGMTPEQVADQLMKDLNPMQVASINPRYFCPCGKDRVKRTVSLLSTDDVEELLQEHGKVQATCEFCGQTYTLMPDEVKLMLQQRRNPSEPSENTDGATQ